MIIDMNYSVYKHTFPNGKVYIGITSRNPEKRWNCGYGYDRHQPVMKNAIKKYGWDNIVHEVLFTNLSKEEAEQKEVELISRYNSYNRDYGYNIEMGGNSNGKHSTETKRKISESNKGEKSYWYGKDGYWNGKHHSEQTKRKIREAMNGESHYWYGKHHSDETKRKISESQKLKRGKAVRCVETKIIYRNQKEAGRQTGIDRSDIGKCCNGKKESAGGYHWESVDCYDDTIKGLSVRCIETGKIYDSISQASRNTGIYKSGIYGACNGTQKAAGGFHWELVN